MQVKEAEEQNKSIRETATIWCLIIKKENAPVSRTTSKDKPQKTTKVNDCRILSLVKKTLCNTEKKSEILGSRLCISVKVYHQGTPS